MSDTNPTDPAVMPVDEAPPVVSPPVDAPLTPPPVDYDEPPTPVVERGPEPQHPDISNFESMSVTEFVAWMKAWVHWKLAQ